MKRCKKLLAVLLTMACMMTMSVSAFAAEPVEAPVGNIETALPTSVSTRSASGYAAHYTDYLTDSFYINVTGSNSSRGTARLKAWDFGANVDVYVSLYRPDGTAALTDVKLPIGTEITKTFSNFPTGTYRLLYHVYGSYRGWIYCDLKNN